MAERDDDFLSRWSRRKVEKRGGGLQKKEPEPPAHKPGRMRTDPPAPKVAAADAEAPLGQEALPQNEQPLAAAEEPEGQQPYSEAKEPVETGNFDDFDFDSLNYASDYSRFMKKGVPDAVRRRALRKLWASNPVLANIDGLNDYDEDFTNAAMVVKAFSSNYKVGSGYLTEEERIASYSEEARKAGEQSAEDDVQEMDVEDMDDDDESSDDVQTASAESEGDAEEDKASGKNDTS